MKHKQTTAFVLLASLALLPAGGHAETLPQTPALNPPKLTGKSRSSIVKESLLKEKTLTEWTYHKNVDGTHPDGTEQQLMWLMNRARANPAAEGQWLAIETDPDVAGGRDYFNVDLDVLKSEFTALTAKPPAAFDIRLYNAARDHSLDLIARDAQDHIGQFDKVTTAGFHYTNARGNVFSYAASGLNGHAAFNIDWGGNDGTGMQDGRGHRKAIMSSDGDYANVGIAAVPDNDTDTQVGPLVITGNYCQADTNYENHYNTFIVGTVWQDKNRNNRYDPGEGIGGVSVTPENGDWFAVTADSGGYAFPAASGSYAVTFHGNGLAADEIQDVTVDQKSVLLDLKIQRISSPSFPWPLFLPAIQRRTGNGGQSDCNGTAGGTAYLDHCHTCVGGTTGNSACAQDCAGVWGGTAVVDRCGVCGGDGTSCSRFSRSASGHLVTDSDTGLTWQDYQITVKEEAPGIAYCNDLSMDGYDDWRFPTFAELQIFFKGVAADTGFDLNHWGSFSGCTASIADGGYVKTPVGAQRYGGNTGDRIYFSGHAAVHCVRP